MSVPPRLLLCSFEAVPSATPLSRRLTEYLRGLGSNASVDLLTVKRDDQHAHATLGAARVLRVPLKQGSLQERGLAFDRAVRRQLESEEYGLIHFTHPWGGAAASELKREWGFRLIYDAQTFPSIEERDSLTDPDRKWLRRQELLCLMQADAVLTGSHLSRNFIHSLGVPLQKIHIVKAPVPVEDFGRPSIDAKAMPGLRLLYLGNLLPHQGVGTLLQAMAQLPRGQLVELLLCGARKPTQQRWLEEHIGHLRLTHRVTLLDAVPHAELPGLLSQVDVGVLPLEAHERNLQAGGPLSKASEYLAGACPILASDLPLTRQELPPDATFYFPAGDAGALSGQISALSVEPAKRTRAAMHAQAWAQSHLSREGVLTGLLEIYRALTSAPWPLSVDASPRVEEEPELLHTQHSGVHGPLPSEGPDPRPGFEQRDPWFHQLAFGYCPPERAPG